MAIIDIIWNRFNRFYGNKFKSQMLFDDEDRKNWADCITGLTKKQVMFGIQKAIMEFQDWSPSLFEFRRVCVGLDFSSERRIYNMCICWSAVRGVLDDSLEARIAQWIMIQLSNDGLAYDFKNMPRHQSEKIFTSYFKLSVFVDLDPVLPLVEEKEEHYSMDYTEYSGELKEIMKFLKENKGE